MRQGILVGLVVPLCLLSLGVFNWSTSIYRSSLGIQYMQRRYITTSTSQPKSFKAEKVMQILREIGSRKGLYPVYLHPKKLQFTSGM
jgi:hypothetical protein